MRDCSRFLTVSVNAAARAARRDVETAMDVAGWPCSRNISLHIDGLLTIEEGPEQ
jgi:hypothetical protein